MPVLAYIVYPDASHVFARLGNTLPPSVVGRVIDEYVTPRTHGTIPMAQAGSLSTWTEKDYHAMCRALAVVFDAQDPATQEGRRVRSHLDLECARLRFGDKHHGWSRFYVDFIQGAA